MKKKITLSPLLLFIISILMAVPALLINLDKQPVIDDEGIRALVAVDMLENGDLITPSIAGEVYLKKPPMYNWLIALSFKLNGSYDEYALRLPMVLSLLFFSLVIFYYFRKEMGIRFAAMASLMFLTAGRIIIYESLHGLIDITYSMVIFIFFMHVYRSFMQGKLVKLFLFGYLIIALAYLIKGLPSIIFLGITMLVLFISNKKFKLLFHWSHILGILAFLLIVGGYYVLYFNRNDVSPADMFNVVLGESTRRTAARFGIWQTILHLLSYPFEMLYHFLPWGLMVVLFFRKGAFKSIMKYPFTRYLGLVFLANIIVYWISPEVYPRYILMLVPLLFGIFAFLYMGQKQKDTLQVRITEMTLWVLLGASTIATVVPFFIKLPVEGTSLYMISAALFLSLVSLNLLYWKHDTYRIFWMALALLILRIGFDLIIIPTRVAQSREVEARSHLQSLAEQTKGFDMKLYWNPDVEQNPYYGYRVTSYRTNYYLVMFRDQDIEIVTETTNDPSTYYISKYAFIDPREVEVLDIFRPPGDPSDLVMFRVMKRDYEVNREAGF